VTQLTSREPHVIAAGIDLLAQAAEGQAARVTRVDWSPPMPGSEADLALVLADPRRRNANERAVQRMLGVRA